MEPRQELYEDVRTMIGERLNDIRTVDLWNENYTYLEEDAAMQLPAALVEFAPIDWDTHFKEQAMICRGTGELRLHLLTEYHQPSDYRQAFRLSDRLLSALALMDADDIKGYSVRRPLQTLTSHNHEDVVESVVVLEVRYQAAYSIEREE